MADKIIPNLTAASETTIDDLLLVVDTPSSAPTNKKITVANIFNKIPTYVGHADTPQTLTGAGEINATTSITLLVTNAANALTIASLVKSVGGIPKIGGIAKDEIRSIESILRESIDSDAIICTAGVSVGDRDYIKEVIKEHGKITFWSVNIQPGKPFLYGYVPVSYTHLTLPTNREL